MFLQKRVSSHPAAVGDQLGQESRSALPDHLLHHHCSGIPTFIDQNWHFHALKKSVKAMQRASSLRCCSTLGSSIQKQCIHPRTLQASCPCISIRHSPRHTNSSHTSQQHVQQFQSCIARASSPENPEVSMEELFAAELANRQAAEAQSAEVAAAAVFDGPALLALLR